MDRFVKKLDEYDMRSNHSSTDRIQSYNLFGEQGDLPDVVHCETIRSRSILNGWTFAPHRHERLHQVLFIEAGGGVATLDGQSVTLEPMCIVNVPIGHVHGYAFKRGTVGFVVTIAAEVLDQVMVPGEGLRRELGRSLVVRASAPMRETFKGIFREFRSRDYARAHVLRGLTAVLVGLVARELSVERGKPRREGRGLAAQFEALLEQHYLEHWTVADYAATLLVTPTHLSRVVRAATGRAASRLIADRVVREARRHLVYTNLSVSTVAFALGYTDPAYFSRIFTKATGHSPRAFRTRASA